MNVYLDNAATTKLSENTKKYLISVLDAFGNPSSLYSHGGKSKKIIEQARKRTADFICANPDTIYFTPSGSASNTLGIRGYYQKHDCCVLYSPIAHKSILKCVKEYKYACPLKVDAFGSIDMKFLKEKLKTAAHKPFVIIDHANSEIGTIQDIHTITELVHLYHGIIYLDCTGSIPSIPLDVRKTDADMLGFSAHKLGGLKGCGVLYKKNTIELEPLIYGTQEQGFIGGTENILGIASLGKAVEHYSYSSVSADNRDHICNFILHHISGSYLIGPPILSPNRLPHNLYICIKDVDGESLMLLLDMYGVQVSTGSACSSRSMEPSAVLLAAGIEKSDIHSCIRMTVTGKETKAELDYVCETLKKCVETLRTIHGEN